MYDELSIRMKTFYEQIPKIKLIRRMPVIIRLDGKAFHTFTKGFKKPFDEILIKTMQETTKYLCENIQGCVLGYTQSDEISLLLVDYKKLNSDAWFDYEVQKMCSIAASMVTMRFNKELIKNIKEYDIKCSSMIQHVELPNLHNDYIKELNTAVEKGAMFDARCFNIPKEEVTNYIYWRQLDASRNSVQMVGQANFSHKELKNKSYNDIQDMLMIQEGINWNDFPVYQKRGTCVIKEEYFINDKGEEIENDFIINKFVENITRRTRWFIDKNIPLFKGEDRNYVEKLFNFESKE